MRVNSGLLMMQSKILIVFCNRWGYNKNKERSAKAMMYPYMTLFDETEIVHSQIIEENNVQKVIVHFERPTEDGFDYARCELPEYKWIQRKGYSDEEIALFEQLLQSNAHLLYQYAAEGGIQIA